MSIWSYCCGRLCAQPCRSFPAPGRDRRCREMRVIVVDHVERVIAAVAGTLDAADEIDNCHIVIAFRGEYAAVARGFDEIIQIPQIIRQLDEKDPVARDRVERLARGAAREDVK